MERTIQHNIPICPKCSSLMRKQYGEDDVHFICVDCKSRWKVIGTGQAEIEVVITDNLERTIDNGKED